MFHHLGRDGFSIDPPDRCVRVVVKLGCGALKLEFLTCGDANSAFWSQAALFRLALNSLGEPYSSARQVLSVGTTGQEDRVPKQWEPWLTGVEIDWVEESQKCLRLYQLAQPTADLSIMCDADTLLLKPLPQSFLEEAIRRPAISGVIAHYPPPLLHYEGSPSRPLTSVASMWNALARRILGRPMEMRYRYTMLDDDSERAPFYVNHGFVAAPAELMHEMGRHIGEILPDVQYVIDNDFCFQIAIACAVERGSLAHRTLPMRFNFPNDPICDRRYPEDLVNVVLIHYLRTTTFDRHRILADAEAFGAFMNLPLNGSNETFRDHVRNLTGGMFPFA
jgi:hypothetical protein